jgi:hypothetical protein
MRIRTVVSLGVLVVAGTASQAGQPKAIDLLARSEKADTRFGKVSLHGGKYQDIGWGRQYRQTLGNWSGYLNPYVRP